jgi:hypothetical protein
MQHLPRCSPEQPSHLLSNGRRLSGNSWPEYGLSHWGIPAPPLAAARLTQSRRLRLPVFGSVTIAPYFTVMQARFFADILKNQNNRAILDRWSALALPDGWLVAGCLFQTVWNLQAGRSPEAGIKDYDLFYFDPADTSEEAEFRVQSRVDALLSDLGITIEVTNQARVHLWYESYFGQSYGQLRSTCEGIDRFLVLATCVGVRPGELYAPNGLALLYDGVLSMNPLSPHRALFDRKANSYLARWSWLQVEAGVPAESGIDLHGRG